MSSIFSPSHAIPEQVIDWDQHGREVAAKVSPSIRVVVATYAACFLLSRLISNNYISTVFALAIPTFVAYAMDFRIHRMSEADLEDRSWHSERMRGLTAGSDVDGDGNPSDGERTKEGAEWVNAILRAMWPTINPELYVSQY